MSAPKLPAPRWCGAVMIASFIAATSLDARADAPGEAPVAKDARVDSDASTEQEARLRAWSGLSFGWDIHAEAVALFKHYTIGTSGAWYSGQGAGGGATASLHFRPPGVLARGALRWVEFELG